jgi:hypothetical protein
MSAKTKLRHSFQKLIFGVLQLLHDQLMANQIIDLEDKYQPQLELASIRNNDGE